MKKPTEDKPLHKLSSYWGSTVSRRIFAVWSAKKKPAKLITGTTGKEVKDGKPNSKIGSPRGTRQQGKHISALKKQARSKSHKAKAHLVKKTASVRPITPKPADFKNFHEVSPTALGTTPRPKRDNQPPSGKPKTPEATGSSFKVLRSDAANKIRRYSYQNGTTSELDAAIIEHRRRSTIETEVDATTFRRCSYQTSRRGHRYRPQSKDRSMYGSGGTAAGSRYSLAPHYDSFGLQSTPSVVPTQKAWTASLASFLQDNCSHQALKGKERSPCKSRERRKEGKEPKKLVVSSMSSAMSSSMGSCKSRPTASNGSGSGVQIPSSTSLASTNSVPTRSSTVRRSQSILSAPKSKTKLKKALNVTKNGWTADNYSLLSSLNLGHLLGGLLAGDHCQSNSGTGRTDSSTSHHYSEARKCPEIIHQISPVHSAAVLCTSPA